jgi:putative flippase GtrA
MKTTFEKWKNNHRGLWQFVLFLLMSGITTIVDFSTYLLFNFWIFKAVNDTPFHFLIIHYSVEDGGLAAFYAFAFSFAISQTFNFFLQRKTTFKADNNVLRSGILYAVMVIGVYFLQLYIPSLIQGSLSLAFGMIAGGMIMKMINMTISMIIQFPMNKYVIMRSSK